MSDLLTYASVFHDVYLYPPLLEACSHIIGEPFKLSSFLARELSEGGRPRKNYTRTWLVALRMHPYLDSFS